jgi:hypothetical protein
LSTASAHHVRLAPAERGQTEHRKLLLQLPDIVMPEREIMQEIVGTFAPCRMHAPKPLQEVGLRLNQQSTNFSELGDQDFERIGPYLIRFQFSGIVGHEQLPSCTAKL